MTSFRRRLHTLRIRLGDLWFFGGMTFLLNRGGDLVNVFIGAWLVPQFVSQDDLGALLPLMAVGTFFSAPLGIVLLPVGKFLNTFLAWGDTGKAKALLQDTLVVVGLFGLALIGWMLWAGDAILLRLQVDDRRLLWPIIGFALISCIQPKLQNAQRALKLFKSTLLQPMLSPFIRLVMMLILLPTLGVLGYLLTQLTVQLTGLLIIGGAVFLAFRGLGRRVSYWPHWREMARYSLPLLGLTIVTRIQAPVELFVIRQRLPLADSAGFYFATIFGALATMFTVVLMPYLMPLMSEAYERGQSTRKLLWHPLRLNLIVGGLFTVLAAVFMPLVFRIPGPWTEYAAYSNFVWQVCLMRVLQTSGQLFRTHEHACRRFTYMWYYVPVMLLEALLLYGLPAWSLTRPYLPESVWNWVAPYAVPDLQRFVGIMIAAHALCFAGMLVQLIARSRASTAANTLTNANQR